MDGAVPARRLGDGIEFLEIVGKYDAGHGPFDARDTDGAVDEVAHLFRSGRHVHVLVRDVLEERNEVDLLLVVAAERRPCLLPDERDHRLGIELRVVEAVEQMDGAGPGSRQAHADLAGKLRVRTGHERGHFLVADLDELHRLFRPIEGAEKAVDTVAWISVDARDAPLPEALEGEVGDCGHASYSVVAVERPGGTAKNDANYDPLCARLIKKPLGIDQPPHDLADHGIRTRFDLAARLVLNRVGHVDGVIVGTGQGRGLGARGGTELVSGNRNSGYAESLERDRIVQTARRA